MARKVTPYLVLAFAGSLLATTLIYASYAPRAKGPSSLAALNPSRDCGELFDLFIADQGDRLPETGESAVDWAKVEERDRSRRDAVRRLYAANKLKTGTDYYRAAVIMQHGKTPDDFLTAHEMATAAVLLGRHSMRWLVAATHDRFLISIGRRQRFGTQYGADALYPVEDGVTDAMRKTLDVPSLAESRDQQAAVGRLVQKGQA
jgi:hypothetical protein